MNCLHTQLKETSAAVVQHMLRLSELLLTLERSKAYKERGCSSARHYASSLLGISLPEVRRFLRVAKQLEKLPAAKKAADEGRLSWHAVQTVAEHATPATEEQWVNVAERATPDQLQDIVRQQEEENGEVHVRWKLEAVTLRLLDQAWTRLSEHQSRALTRNESLQLMAAQVLNAGTSQIISEHMAVHFRKQAAEDIAADRIPWRNPFTPKAPVVLTKVGSITPDSKIRFNPKARVATPAQRRELRRRGRFRCATPGCCNRLWLQIHHIKFFREGGETEPGNLVLLCSSCHRLLHDDDLSIEGQPPDQLRFYDRKGEELRGGPPPEKDSS